MKVTKWPQKKKTNAFVYTQWMSRDNVRATDVKLIFFLSFYFSFFQKDHWQSTRKWSFSKRNHIRKRLFGHTKSASILFSLSEFTLTLSNDRKFRFPNSIKMKRRKRKNRLFIRKFVTFSHFYGQLNWIGVVFTPIKWHFWPQENLIKFSWSEIDKNCFEI